MVLWHEDPCRHADVNSGTVHTVTVTSANKADIGELPALLREEDKVIWATPATHISEVLDAYDCTGKSMTSASQEKAT